MTEIWKEHPSMKGLYLVSNTGRIKSVDRVVNSGYGSTRTHKGLELKQFQNERGYLCVVISIDKQAKIKKVHRLVAETFIDNPYDKKQVNHIDGNKQNNNVNNLEWCNNSENMLHAYKIGLKVGRRKQLCLI